MQPDKKLLRKFSLLLIAFSVWMWWDLSQAHSNLSALYKSFFVHSDATASNHVTNLATTVSIVRSNDAALAHPCGVADEGINDTTISEMVRRAVDLVGGLHGLITSQDTVLIKPNIVQQDSSGSGGVTDVRVVKALVFMVDEIDHGNIQIVVGDGSPRPFTTFEKSNGSGQTPWDTLFDVPGYLKLIEEASRAGIKIRLTNLNGNSDTDPWPELDSVCVPGGGYSQPQGGHYHVHKDVTHASVYISVPVMKSHNQPGYTGALKNQIGLAASSRYGFSKSGGVWQDGHAHKLHQNSGSYDWYDEDIVDLSIIAKVKFVVVDAITCLETIKSPRYDPSDHSNIKISNRVTMNTIVAGYDPVAVDHVCCRIMGLNPDDIEHITLAERAGLGTNDPDSIVIVGATIEATRRIFKKDATRATSIFGQSNRTWLLSDTFSTSGITDPIHHEFIANEASLAPVSGVDGWSQPVYFIDDQIALKEYYQPGSDQSVVSYAFTYFEAPATQGAELWVGSDEAMKVYLNGQVVYTYAGIRTFSETDLWSEIVPITINRGLNSLLVKTYQGSGSTNNYTFSLNICEVQPDINYRGTRVLGLKFTTVGAPTSVDAAGSQTITAFELHNCYPNPFNPRTTIRYRLSRASGVKLVIFDMLGQEVATLVNEVQPAGTHSIDWDGSNRASGVFFSRLTADRFSQVKKMMLLK